MKLADIAGLRLHAQHVAQADFDKPEDAVKHLLAMQAQDYNGGLWSVGLRTKNATAKDIEQALKDRKIIRSWPMRGTLHLMHADDVHWLTGLLASQATASARNRRIGLGLHDDIMLQVENLLRELLSDRPLRRDELQKALQAAIMAPFIDNILFGHILRHFGERGLLCFGPPDGKQATFVLLDAWIKPPLPKPREQALAELASRYVIGHGPVTLKDFAGWGMLTMADAKAGLAAAVNIIATDINGQTYYHVQDLPAPKPSGTLLLPGFDEYLLGYKDRSAMLAPEHVNKVIPGGNGIFKASIITNGQVVGTWSRSKRKALTIEPVWFNKPADIPVKLVQRYADFLGVETPS